MWSARSNKKRESTWLEAGVPGNMNLKCSMEYSGDIAVSLVCYRRNMKQFYTRHWNYFLNDPN